MKLYIVIYNVDLGYHIERIYTDEAKANARCAEMNVEYNKTYSGHWGDKFEVIIHEVEE
jgi:hypothetical protein